MSFKASFQEVFRVHSLKIYLSSGIFLVICIVGWFLNPSHPPQELPFIRAPSGPDRFRPESHINSEVPDQHRQIYKHIEKNISKKNSKVEKLLPPDETPLEIVSPDEIKEEASPPLESVENIPAISSPEVKEPKVSLKTPQKQSDARSIEELLQKVPPQSFSSSSKFFHKGGKYTLQLGSLSTQKQAKKEWRRLAPFIKNNPLFQGASPFFQKVDSGAPRGVIYRIILKGVTSKSAAQKLCKILKDKKISCLIL